MATFVYLCIKPGSDIDGEPAEFCAHNLEAAQIRADRHARACRAQLLLVAEKVNGRINPCVSYEAAPWWLQEQLDAQRERDGKVAAHNAQKKARAAARPRLTKTESAEVKSLMVDGGYSRQEALAWVRQFGAAS